ncbi:MAG: hypothetical protein R3F53_17060 [Gammaproteobacteria bacterium]
MEQGAYLVRHLGHCGECHTPRNWAGALDEAYFLAGNPDGPEGDAVPNITNDLTTVLAAGLPTISVIFLEIGMLPDIAGSSMGAVIDDNTSQLSTEDQRRHCNLLHCRSPATD